jgi:hypothetical protein
MKLDLRISIKELSPVGHVLTLRLFAKGRRGRSRHRFSQAHFRFRASRHCHRTASRPRLIAAISALCRSGLFHAACAVQHAASRGRLAVRSRLAAAMKAGGVQACSTPPVLSNVLRAGDPPSLKSSFGEASGSRSVPGGPLGFGGGVKIRLSVSCFVFQVLRLRCRMLYSRP